MIELGLHRISRLMASTPMPWRAVHVAGTNGKGSVCSYISDMLNIYNRSKIPTSGSHLGLKHGRFTSPHLVDPWDCITFNGEDHVMRPIEEQLFRDIMTEMSRRNRERNINATNFELLTATAFEAFTHANLDIAVVEVGMGGRLDSTNIIGQPPLNDDRRERMDVVRASFRPPPLVTAITKIGLDHQDFLGSTIEAIAREKSGIFKEYTPVVYDSSNESPVCEVIRDVAHEKKAPQVRPADGATLHLSEPTHKLQNLATAVECVDLALEGLGELSGLPVKHPDLRHEMLTSASSITFPGRQEIVDIGPVTRGSGNRKLALLDGAHNVQSASALAKALSSANLRRRRPYVWILAASDSKDIEGILRPLLQTGDTVFAVEFGPVEDMPWVTPMKGTNILQTVQALPVRLASATSYGRDIHGAIRAAIEASSPEPDARDIVVTGSLYLVGDVHRMLRKQAFS